MADAAVHKYLAEIQEKVVDSSRKLSAVNAKIVSVDREVKICDLTLADLKPLEATKPRAFRAVGKIFILDDLSDLTNELNETKEKGLKEKVGLEKTAKKLDSDIKDAQRAFREILGKFQQQQQQQQQS